MTHSASFCWLYRLRLTAKARLASTVEPAVYFSLLSPRCFGQRRIDVGVYVEKDTAD